MDEEVNTVCPKCGGQGSKRYRLWDSKIILHNLIYLKKKVALEELGWSMFVIKIKCPICDGDGKLDWIRKATKGENHIPFRNHRGFMELYWAKAVTQWPVQNGTHDWCIIKDFPLYQYPDKLIECAQKRYRTFRLHSRVLSLGLHDLKELSRRVDDCYDVLVKTPVNKLTRTIFINEFKTFGLKDYMPDTFVYPGLDDYPRVS
jgi:hypothetical protein